MAFFTRKQCTVAALLLAAKLAQAQLPSEASTDAVTTEPVTAFELDIRAPDAVQQLLSKHLELQRYRVMPDLTDAEVQSLLLSAQKDATDLVATLGYFSPVIGFSLLPGSGSATRAIRLDVEPGPQTRVADVRLVLDGPIAKDPQSASQRRAIEDGWSLPANEVFTQSTWDAAKEQALKQLLSRRFAAATLRSSRAEIDADKATAALEVHLESGPAYTVGSLDVQGTRHYSEALVRRFARLQTGDDYALSELADAQKRLTDSGYFDSAYLSLDLASDPAAAVVRAQVKEASLQKLVFGVGGSTDSGARWSAEHTHNQVPGIGWRAINKVSGDRYTHAFSSDWTSQPEDSQWRWATSALLSQNSVGQIDVNTQRYRFGRFTSRSDLDQSYYLQLERTAAFYQENFEEVVNDAVTANYAFSLRRFDSIPFPSRGWGIGGELAVGSVLGTEQEPYSRVLLHWRAYQPLENANASLFNRQRSGRMVYRAEVGAVLGANNQDIPFTQLFLAGGDSSVRGYKRDEIGVTHDGILSADSGRYMVTGSVEWQRPIVVGGVMTEWEGALFVDTGAVANRTEELSFKVGVGIGARWKSPIGPLQVDLGYGVATQALRLHLNVGFVF